MNAALHGSAERYLAAFIRVSAILPGRRHDWLRQLRETAIRRFASKGFPTQRDEDWKYTSVTAIETSSFGLLAAPCPDRLSALVAAHAMPDAHLLVFVNGHMEPGLSRPGRLPRGVILSSLAYLLEHDPTDLSSQLLGTGPTSAFEDLNLAFMSDGAYVRLPPGSIVKQPIQLLFITSEANLATHPRNLIQATTGSSACIVEQHIAAGEFSYFSNPVTNLPMAVDSNIEHHKLQQESPLAFHIATLKVTQAASSRLVSGSYALGGRLARVGITVALQGEGAACELNGLYLGDGRQHIDHHTCIEHLQPGGSSRQLYKGILGGTSRAVFNGRVVVHPDAQRSDALQANHNLLLSENAEIDTKPQLEIWADDVKCAHGATVGQLDEEQVFYLRSRGIEQSAARSLLTRAFAREVVDKVRHPALQERLDELLRAKLTSAGALPC